MKILEFMIRNQILSWENPCQGVTENTRGILRAAFETDSEWDGLAKTAVFQHGMDKPVAVPVTGETVEIPPEVIVAGEMRVGLVGLGSGGTVQIPTRWMNKPIIIQPSTPVTGKGPEAIAPEAWEKALASIGNLSDLNTEAKNNLVAAINEVLQTGGIPGANGREVELSVVDSYIVWRYVGESAWRNLIALSDLKGDSGRGVKSIAGSADGSWTITYTDNTTENVSSAAYAALKNTVDKAVLTDAMSLTVAQQAQVRTNIAAAAAADLANYYQKSETYSQSEINAKISAIPKFSIAPVTTLPANGISATTVYLVKTNSADNLYMEYIFVPTNSAATGPFTDSQGRWEPLGAQTVDLTGYATEAWANLTFQPIGSYVTEEKFESLSKSVSELSSQKVTAPAKAQIGQTIAVKSIDETGKPIEWEAVDMTSGSGEAAAIIDVIELPTENINEDVFYRLLSGSLVFNQYVLTMYTVYCVETLPETGEPATNADTTAGNVYYSVTENETYGYVDNTLSAGLGVPVGWYPAATLFAAVGYEYAGTITNILDDPSDNKMRLLLEYVVYDYKEGNWTSHKKIGWTGTGISSEIFNRPKNEARGECSHAEGDGTTANGANSHAEGSNTTTGGVSSHAEGGNTTARGGFSHAEGNGTTANGVNSHAEGGSTTAGGVSSHAEGSNTAARGDFSHAEGSNTTARGDSQHVQGKFNIEDTNNRYAHIVGNGKTDKERSNAHTLDWDGNAWFAGTVEGTALILKSPNGRRFRITVSDDGTLSAAAIG